MFGSAFFSAKAPDKDRLFVPAPIDTRDSELLRLHAFQACERFPLRQCFRGQLVCIQLTWIE